MGLFEPWLRPFPILFGLIVLALCGFITAHYLLPRTAGQLQEDFRKRAAIAGIVLTALGAGAVVLVPSLMLPYRVFGERLETSSA